MQQTAWANFKRFAFDTRYEEKNKMNELKIEYLPIDKLNHYANNSKIHTKEQIEHIANSI